MTRTYKIHTSLYANTTQLQDYIFMNENILLNSTHLRPH